MPFSLDLQTIYFWSAVAGGALLLIQIVLALFGGDADADAGVDFDVDQADIGGHLSLRTVVAFVTFFGIAGMASSSAGLGSAATLVIAVLVGSLAFWLVGLAMFQMARLRSSGTVDPHNAIGAQAQVYLEVPAKRSGTGRVTVPIQGRTMQYKAVTEGRAIPTGQYCKVVALHAGDTLEVVAS